MKDCKSNASLWMESIKSDDINSLSMDVKEPKVKKDKKDTEAKAEYSNWRKRVMNLFRATLKTIHPNENQIPSIGMLYTAGSLLTYIDRSDLIYDNPNVDSNNDLIFKRFEDINSFFNNADIKARMQQIFIDADDVIDKNSNIGKFRSHFK